MAAPSPRELLGAYCLLPLTFAELEAGVSATTKLRWQGSAASDAGDPPMPKAGYVVGLIIGSEASSNFTVQFTVDGTPNTVNTVTVNAAAKSLWLDSPIAFTSGQTVGAYVVADTTSKDVVVIVLVALNVGT